MITEPWFKTDKVRVRCDGCDRSGPGDGHATNVEIAGWLARQAGWHTRPMPGWPNYHATCSSCLDAGEAP